MFIWHFIIPISVYDAYLRVFIWPFFIRVYRTRKCPTETPATIDVTIIITIQIILCLFGIFSFAFVCYFFRYLPTSFLAVKIYLRSLFRDLVQYFKSLVDDFIQHEAFGRYVLIWHFLIHFCSHHKLKSFHFQTKPISSHILYLCQNSEQIKIPRRTSRIFRGRTRRVYLAFFCSLISNNKIGTDGRTRTGTL